MAKPKKHNCKKVHPKKNHKEWLDGQDDTPDNLKESKKKKGKGKPPWLKNKGGDDDKKGKKGKPPWLKNESKKHKGKGKGKKGGKSGNPRWSKEFWGESANISQFIKNMAQKNYAEANKYLQASLERKMKTKISEANKKFN